MYWPKEITVPSAVQKIFAEKPSNDKRKAIIDPPRQRKSPRVPAAVLVNDDEELVGPSGGRKPADFCHLRNVRPSTLAAVLGQCRSASPVIPVGHFYVSHEVADHYDALVVRK